jgi:hypothetical protein
MTSVFAMLGALLLLVAAPAAQDGGAEALVERIKQQLGQVDRALQEAADAEAVTGQLAAARTAHLAVIRDLESLIKQIKYQRSQQGGGGGSPPQPRPPSGQEPSSSEGQPPPRESDGSGAPEPQSQQQGGEEHEQQGDQPQPGEEQPQGGGPDQDVPREGAGSNPPPPDTAPYTREDTDARWGLLPPKMQERLMNLHVDDVPERYRAWMDAYIRELNRLEQGERRP